MSASFDRRDELLNIATARAREMRALPPWPWNWRTRRRLRAEHDAAIKEYDRLWFGSKSPQELDVLHRLMFGDVDSALRDLRASVKLSHDSADCPTTPNPYDATGK